jgi:deoxyribonuclease-1
MPESADTNRQRSNYQVGMVPGEDRAFGSCDVEMKDRTFEPRPEIRGDIVRIYFYMD